MMDGADTFFLSVFLAFLAAMLGLGILVARKVRSGEDFLLAGRGLKTPLLLGTTLATMVGTGSSLGAVGFAFESGYAGALYGIGGVIGIFSLLILFADVRNNRFMTFSEEIGYYYGASKTVRGLVSIVLLLASIGWLGAHVLGGATYLSYITDMNLALAKVIVAVGFGLYTVIGGYLAVVITDAVQGFILFVGFFILAVLSVIRVGGIEGFSQSLSSDQLSFLGISGLGLIPAISFAVVIAVGVLATPSYRHRIYSAASTSTVRRSFLITGVLYAVFALFPAIAGMSAAVLNPGLENSDFAFPYLATEVFPLWIGALLLVSGLSATMSSGDSEAVVGVTILLRDVYQTVTGRLPAQNRMVMLSRFSLVVVLGVAFVFTLAAESIIDYITLMISTILSGLFVAALLGKFWPRATWQGGIASIVGGSIVALVINASESMTAFWGNPVLPSLAGALVVGVLVSLVTPRQRISREETLRILEEERSQMDVGTKLRTTEEEG